MAIGNQLVVDRTLNECLQNGSYWHYYQTYLHAGQRIVIRQQSAAFDTFVCAKANTATLWDCNDDISTTDSNSELVLTAATAGYFDVAAGSFNLLATGAYRLMVSSTPVYITDLSVDHGSIPVPIPITSAEIRIPKHKPRR
jgi:hypothetical protein